MVNTSIALNAWGGPFLVGSHTIPGEIFITTATTSVATLGSFYIPANTIVRGLQLFEEGLILGPGDASPAESHLIIKVGPSGSETVVVDRQGTQTVTTSSIEDVNLRWVSEDLNTGSVTGVIVAGSLTQEQAIDLMVRHNAIWGYTY